MEHTKRLAKVPSTLIRREFQKALPTDTVAVRVLMFSTRYDPKKNLPAMMSILLLVIEIIIHRKGITEKKQTTIKKAYMGIFENALTGIPEIIFNPFIAGLQPSFE
jgi:hypothetical protein